MAAVLTGTPVAVTWAAGASPSSQNVTIPSDATAVYMFWDYYVAAGGSGIASATLNGASPDQLLELGVIDGLAAAVGGCVWYNPSTGSQALAVAWDNAPSDGSVCIVCFVKDGDTTAWRDADVDQDSATTAVGVTLTTVSGDLVLKFNGNSTTTPSTSSGWTSAQTASNNGRAARLSYISATGATQACDAEDEDYATIIAISIPAGGPAPDVTDVTPDVFADAATGIDVDGTDFEASQGTGRVVISPVDDIDGEPTIGVTRFGGATGGTNPTTTTTVAIPASLPTDCVLILAFTSRDHTSGTGQPTVVDDNSGAAWSQDNFSTDRKAQQWSKRYEAGLSGKTITIAGAVGSLTGVLLVADDSYESSGFITDYALQTNSSGTESHAAVTPTYAGSAVVLVVFNYANDNAVSSVTAATTGAPSNTTGHLSTGGSDCGTSVSIWANHPASSSGALTWAQTNGTTYSMAFAIRPRAPAGAAVEQTVTAWGDTQITFTADQDTLGAGVGLYLFVENDSGNSNASGFPVQFTAGGGGGAPWVPAYLLMLRANQ